MSGEKVIPEKELENVEFHPSPYKPTNHNCGDLDEIMDEDGNLNP